MESINTWNGGSTAGYTMRCALCDWPVEYINAMVMAGGAWAQQPKLHPCGHSASVVFKLADEPRRDS